MTNSKPYIAVVTLPTQGNAKLLLQLKSDFKRPVTWNIYQSKKSPDRQNRYLDYLITPRFQGVNRLFVLLLENEDARTTNTGYYFLKVEIKDDNVKIHGRNVYDQPINGDVRTYENIKKIGLVKEMITQLAAH